MITFMYIQKVKDITLKKFFLILIFNSLLYLGIIIYFLEIMAAMCWRLDNSAFGIIKWLKWIQILVLL